MREEADTVDARIEQIDQAISDITSYLCSRGDTLHLRDETEKKARLMLNALAVSGWKLSK